MINPAGYRLQGRRMDTQYPTAPFGAAPVYGYPVQQEDAPAQPHHSSAWR